MNNRGIFALVMGRRGERPKSGRRRPSAPARQHDRTGQQASGRPLLITGMVTNVDGSTRQLSVVVSASQDQRLLQVGRSITVQRDVSLVDLEGPVAANSLILRDGKQARFNALREGDVVRATFDPVTRSFSNVHAVSRQELRTNLRQARIDLL